MKTILLMGLFSLFGLFGCGNPNYDASLASAPTPTMDAHHGHHNEIVHGDDNIIYDAFGHRLVVQEEK